MIIKTLRRKKLVDDKHHSKNFTNPNRACTRGGEAGGFIQNQKQRVLQWLRT